MLGCFLHYLIVTFTHPKQCQNRGKVTTSKLTCVRANLFRNDVVLGRDRKKLLIWNATTGRGYNLRVRVCSIKFASMFWELKKRTCNEMTVLTCIIV